MQNAVRQRETDKRKKGCNLEKKKKGEKPVRSGSAAKDIYAMRKRRKRRKVLKQSIWLLLLAVTVLVLYQRRDSWIPKLETIGMRHSSRQYGTADHDGNFPISVYSDNDYRIAEVGGKLLVLSDSYFYIYEPDGSLAAARQLTYGNAMMQTAGDYALLYENGGTRFRLETAEKLRYEKTLTDPIVFGRVSENGLAAVVTGSQSCACKLLVFNIKGQQLYERDCVERLADIAFHADEKGCYAVRLEAENGVMKSVVNSYSFSSAESIWSSQPLDMLAISVYNTVEGDVFVLGDTKCCYLDAGGTVKSVYSYPDALIRGVFSGNTAALLLGNDETRSKTVVILNGPSGSPALRTYEKDVKDIGFIPENEELLVQMRKEFETLSYQCSVIRTTQVPENCDGFLRIGTNLFLRSYDHIDRLEYRSS